MPRRRRLFAQLVLQAVVLAFGVGAAAAHDGPSATATAVPAPAAPVVARERPTTRPRPVTPRATPAARRTVAPRVVATRRPAPRKALRPRATASPTAAATPQATRVARPASTASDRLMQAVARIPGYRTGEAQWVIRPGLGSWGLAAMGGSTVYISPDVPADKLYDVVAHEWSHLLMVTVYGGEVNTALFAANAFFGGSELTGAERAADCMARLLGARWTHYTSCTDARWRDGARRLVNRQRL